MKVERDQVQFTNVVQFRLIPQKLGSTLEGTIPDVSNCEFWYCSGDVVTITNFLGGSAFQILHILGDGFTTLQFNTNIKTNTAADKLLASNKIYTLTLFGTTWVENA